MKIYSDSINGMYTVESKYFDFKLHKIIVFDVYGNQIIIIDHPSEKQNIDLSNSPSGIYHISAVFDKNHPPIRLKIFKN